MDYTLELIVVPVSDVDRAKAFYIEQAGFDLLVDSQMGPDFRVVQLVPKGSACAIAIGTGIGSMAPGSLHGLHLVVGLIWFAVVLGKARRLAYTPGEDGLGMFAIYWHFLTGLWVYLLLLLFVF